MWTYLEWKSGASRRNSNPGCVSTMSLKRNIKLMRLNYAIHVFQIIKNQMNVANSQPLGSKCLKLILSIIIVNIGRPHCKQTSQVLHFNKKKNACNILNFWWHSSRFDYFCPFGLLCFPSKAPKFAMSFELWMGHFAVFSYYRFSQKQIVIQANKVVIWINIVWHKEIHKFTI